MVEEGNGNFLSVSKSKRHDRIIGDFREMMITNWLSRSGYEVVIVDLAAIDIIASNPTTGHKIGVSVKSACLKDDLAEKGDDKPVLQGRGGKKIDEVAKEIIEACKIFGEYEPWVAVYQERKDAAHLYMTSLRHFVSNVGKPRMNDSRLDWDLFDNPEEKGYDSDSKVFHVHFTFSSRNWPPAPLDK